MIEQLKRMKAFENTLILFASDNGASAEIMIRSGGREPERSARKRKIRTYALGPGFSSTGNTPFRRHKTRVHEGGISTLIARLADRHSSEGRAPSYASSHVIDLVPVHPSGKRMSIDKPKQWQGEKIPTAPGKSLLHPHSPKASP